MALLLWVAQARYGDRGRTDLKHCLLRGTFDRQLARDHQGAGQPRGHAVERQQRHGAYGRVH